jgi:hypothetical protein
MSDFVIRKTEERTSKHTSFSLAQETEKELSLVLKLLAFFATFFGLIYLSINSNNLMLSEILVVGGILSMVFFIHIVSNR